jgi:hypothetical protein
MAAGGSGLSTVSDFLSAVAKESLQKPLQPAGLIPSAVFVLLNVLLVYPVLLAGNLGPAIAVSDLDVAGQSALLVLLILVLSYVLLSLSAGTLRRFTGEQWSRSWLACLGRGIEKGRRDSVPTWHAYEQLRTDVQGEAEAHEDAERKAKEQDEAEWAAGTPEEAGTAAAARAKTERDAKKREAKKERLLTKLAYYRYRRWYATNNFPAEEGTLAPSSLGNVLNATASYLWERYRIDFTALWPYMDVVVAQKDPVLQQRLQDDKAAQDALLNLSIILAVFSCEYLLVRVFLPAPAIWRLFVPVAVAMFLAYVVFYRAALSKARSWSQGIQMAFDLRRDDLRQSLGVRAFKSRADERRVWSEVSKWILWGPPVLARDSAGNFPYSDLFVSKEWKADKLFKDGGATPAAQPTPSAPGAGVPAAQPAVPAAATEPSAAGHVRPAAGAAAAPATPAGASITHCSTNLHAEILSDAVVNSAVDAPGGAAFKRLPSAASSQVVQYYAQEAHYTVLLEATAGPAATTAPGGAGAAYLVISDPRVSWIEQKPEQEPEYDVPEAYAPHMRCWVQRTGKDQPACQLLWHVARLPAVGPILLRYTLPVPILAARTNKAELLISDVTFPPSTGYYSFTVTNTSRARRASRGRLEVYHAGAAAQDIDSWRFIPRPALEVQPPSGLHHPSGWLWTLPPLGPYKRVTLIYVVSGASGAKDGRGSDDNLEPLATRAGHSRPSPHSRVRQTRAQRWRAVAGCSKRKR